MTRILTFAAGLAVVIATGVAYGAWTQRWQKSPDLQARAARLKALPDDLGRWKSEPAELAPEALEMAGAEGWWVRRFTDERTGTSLLVILLCGKPGAMIAHRPEVCYGAAGYVLEAPAVKIGVPAAPGAAASELWAGKFGQAETGGRELRIDWSWYDGSAWRASDNPRWDFARLSALYKLYVVRDAAGPAVRPDDEPAADFLRRFVPAAARALKETPE